MQLNKPFASHWQAHTAAETRVLAAIIYLTVPTTCRVCTSLLSNAGMNIPYSKRPVEWAIRSGIVSAAR